VCLACYADDSLRIEGDEDKRHAQSATYGGYLGSYLVNDVSFSVLLSPGMGLRIVTYIETAKSSPEVIYRQRFEEAHQG
jgi:hypothetical protein